MLVIVWVFLCFKIVFTNGGSNDLNFGWLYDKAKGPKLQNEFCS